MKIKPNFLTIETRRELAATMRRGRDNTRSILLYMLERKAFGDIEVPGDVRILEFVDGFYSPHGMAVVITKDCPPGVPWRNRRPRSLTLYEARDWYATSGKGRRQHSRYMGKRYEHIACVEIPHWDAYAHAEIEMSEAAD